MLDAQSAVEVVQAVEALVSYSVWKFLTMFDSNVCTDCYLYSGDEYELEDPTDLQAMFPYGYFINEDTFAPMVHPNDRCRIERVRTYIEGELIK